MNCSVQVQDCEVRFLIREIKLRLGDNRKTVNSILTTELTKEDTENITTESKKEDDINVTAESKKEDTVNIDVDSTEEARVIKYWQMSTRQKEKDCVNADHRAVEREQRKCSLQSRKIQETVNVDGKGR